MKKRIEVCLIGCLISFGLFAQDQFWTLDDCIRYAIDHNLNIHQMKLQQSNAEINLNTAQMSRLPDLNASISPNWKFGYVPSENNVSAHTKATQNTGFSVGSSLPLFSGFRISNEIAKNKLDLAAATQDLQKAQEDIALNVTYLFLQVLFNKELMKVNEQQVDLTKKQVEKTKALTNAEKVPRSQLYDMEAQAAKDEVALIQAKNNVDLALLDLAQSLELSGEIVFDIVSPETDREDLNATLQPISSIYANALNIKPEIKAQSYRIAGAEKSKSIAQSAYWPTLSLSMGYGTSYFYNYNNNTNAAFSQQIRDWGSEYIGLTLNIPIFNRFSVRNQVRSAQLNIDNRQWELEKAKKTLYKEIQTAYLNATAAQQKFAASEKAVKASTESFQYAQERYEVGKSSVFEFNEAKNRLIQSQSELIQAKYDYIFRCKILAFYNGEVL